MNSRVLWKSIKRSKKFELIKFHGDKMCKPVLKADDVKEIDKIKFKKLQTTDSVMTVRHIYL